MHPKRKELRTTFYVIGRFQSNFFWPIMYFGKLCPAKAEGGPVRDWYCQILLKMCLCIYFHTGVVLPVLVEGVYKPPKIENYGSGFVPRDLEWRHTWYFQWRRRWTSNGGALDLFFRHGDETFEGFGFIAESKKLVIDSDPTHSDSDSYHRHLFRII